MEFSKFGRRFTRHTGASELMDDMGAAMDGQAPMLMLGGGNPARIPEMEQVFKDQLAAIIERALDLPPGPDAFDDDNGHIFEGAINAIALAGISHGCGPDAFCPDDDATRRHRHRHDRRSRGSPASGQHGVRQLRTTRLTSRCGLPSWHRAGSWRPP